ncbi:zinc-binding oxidoreductase CipB [Cucurbitaria berberidis CBS 394.84]|uniref:Zinc-binding oxidoreductase CipB n=1 Tax=Cucurbitaria berberidis CBS 394.84 TaxID=1168544 RepID=A0A9P4GLQ1_9PLEO|nr:zinc-binding oxidoreductase CipB [Cucurbitaria berberidis CBS 394.84]KAF1847494.1 zinc-binding oxidoreductase CipB [Cucurbitaria berberidis CBS 394.84]
MSNKAAWITEPKGRPLQVKEAPLPKAGKGQVVIKNHAVAVNPVDWKIQDYGIFLQTYPYICGTDVAGEIYEVGEGVTHVKKGDRVLGHALSLVTNNAENGGFQLYTSIDALVVSKIPSSLSYTSAAVLPLAISTAATCLFKKETLALPTPTSASKPSPSGKSVLIWGGSSSVGATAIQLAVGAGVKVVTVAGKHNLDNLKALGAAAAFDYKSPKVADDIITALEGTEFAGVVDAIGTPESAAAWTPVYKKLGGRYGSVMPGAQGLPEGIQGADILGPSVALSDRDIGEAVWAKWVPAALEAGTLKAVPEAIVIKGGLDSVQKGYDEQKKGVSFGKIVVEL